MTLRARLYNLLVIMMLGLFVVGGYSLIDMRGRILDERELELRGLVDSVSA
jgi:hypothetical protein